MFWKGYVKIGRNLEPDLLLVEKCPVSRKITFSKYFSEASLPYLSIIFCTL